MPAQSRHSSQAAAGAARGRDSTSVVAQYTATLQGHGLAILPCFLAAQDPRLVALLPDEVVIDRQFWMYCREDLRKLKRITLLWDYIRQVTELNAPLLRGETREMRVAEG